MTPGWKTRVVSAGMAVLASLAIVATWPPEGLGAWRMNGFWMIVPVLASYVGIDASATTTTGPPFSWRACCAAKKADGSNWPSPLRS